MIDATKIAQGARSSAAPSRPTSSPHSPPPRGGRRRRRGAKSAATLRLAPPAAVAEPEVADALAAAAEEGGKETKPLGLAAVGGCVSYLRRLLLDRQTVPLGNFTTWTPSDGVEATAAVRSPARQPATASTRRLYHHRRRRARLVSPPSVPQARSLVLDSKAIDNLELFANSSDHGADGDAVQGGTDTSPA